VCNPKAANYAQLSGLAGTVATAHMMNALGDVVGSSPDKDGISLPVLWLRPQYVPTQLPISTLLEQFPDRKLSGAEATGINRRGTVVGNITFVGFGPTAVAWQGPDHVVEVLGDGNVQAINDDELVVGTKYNQSPGHDAVVVWDLQQHIQVVLPSRPYTRGDWIDLRSYAVGINNAGDAIASAYQGQAEGESYGRIVCDGPSSDP
jgi:hypothetical protein